MKQLLFNITALLFILCIANNSYACSSCCDIFVDGDLFLDYSVFGENEDLFITGDIVMAAKQITIYSYDQKPMIPELSFLAIFPNPSTIMNKKGNVLLFSDTPIINGRFEATGDICIGNYSSLKPVPLPPAILLFLLSQE